jgi:proteasome alpha subunit
MEMQPGQMAYDRAITVFSPDGRLFQVEYAREAVRRGATTAGVLYEDGVALVADRRIPNPKLAEPSSLEKIHLIDDQIACATAGLVADARVLVDYARLAAQIHRVTYAEPISVELLVRRICDYKQQYTQFGGVRPFGTALLVGGFDDLGVHLFETEPSGSLTSFRATSTGGNKGPAMELFEQKFKPGMDSDAAVMLALEGLRESLEDSANLSQVEVLTLDREHGSRRFGTEEIQKYVSRLPPLGGKSGGKS